MKLNQDNAVYSRYEAFSVVSELRKKFSLHEFLKTKHFFLQSTVLRFIESVYAVVYSLFKR